MLNNFFTTSGLTDQIAKIIAGIMRKTNRKKIPTLKPISDGIPEDQPAATAFVMFSNIADSQTNTKRVKLKAILIINFFFKLVNTDPPNIAISLFSLIS